MLRKSENDEDFQTLGIEVIVLYSTIGRLFDYMLGTSCPTAPAVPEVNDLQKHCRKANERAKRAVQNTGITLWPPFRCNQLTWFELVLVPKSPEPSRRFSRAIERLAERLGGRWALKRHSNRTENSNADEELQGPIWR